MRPAWQTRQRLRLQIRAAEDRPEHARDVREHDEGRDKFRWLASLAVLGTPKPSIKTLLSPRHNSGLVLFTLHSDAFT